MLRYAGIATYAWVTKRHQKAQFEKDPLALWEMGDERVPLETRREKGVRLYSKRVCCVPWGMARELREHATLADLMGKAWACIWRRSAGMVMLGIPDVECRHGRNRQRHQRLTKWTTFCCKFINCEA